MFYRNIALLLCVSFSHSVYAESLTEVYSLALQNDFKLKAAQSNYMADQENKDIAFAELLPKIDLEASFSKSENSSRVVSSSPFTINSERVNNNQITGYTISLNQPLFDFSAYRNYQKGEITSLRAQLELENSKQDLIVRVTDIYLQILKARADYDVLVETQKALSKNLTSIDTRVNHGISRISEFNEAKASYDSSVADTIAAKNLLNILFDSLSVITSKPHIQLEESLKNDFQPNISSELNLQQLVEVASAKNLDLNIAHLKEQEARKNIEALEASHLPTIYSRLSYSDSSDERIYNYAVPDTLNQNGWMVSVNFSLPLYAGGKQSATSRQAKYQHLQQTHNFSQIKQEVTHAVYSNYMNIISGEAALKASNTAKTSSKMSLTSAQQEYASGIINIQQFIDIQRAYFSAQRRYFESVYSYLIANINLKRTTGIISIKDIEYISFQLDKDLVVRNP